MQFLTAASYRISVDQNGLGKILKAAEMSFNMATSCLSNNLFGGGNSVSEGVAVLSQHIPLLLQVWIKAKN